MVRVTRIQRAHRGRGDTPRAGWHKGCSPAGQDPKEVCMDQANEQRMAPLIEALRQDPGGGSDLPDPAGAIVRAALAGQTVYQIAQAQAMSEEAVWRSLSDAARAAAG